MFQTPHPAKAVLVLRGITQKRAAAAVGVNPHTFGRVLNGHVPPWPAFRQRLSLYLDLPEHELFRESETAA